jgi:hypothetical protein
MGLGNKLWDLPKESDAGHAKVEKQSPMDRWCTPQNDVNNQTATNAFEHPDFEKQKEERQARRER